MLIDADNAQATLIEGLLAEAARSLDWVQPVVIWATDEASRGTLALEQPATPVWPAEAIAETAGEQWQRRAALDAETVEQVEKHRHHVTLSEAKGPGRDTVSLRSE